MDPMEVDVDDLHSLDTKGKSIQPTQRPSPLPSNAYVNGRVEKRNGSDVERVRLVTTGFVYDVRMRLHGNVHEDEHHPEDPSRITAILQVLREAKCTDTMFTIAAREARKEEVLLVHGKEHWDLVQRTAGAYLLVKPFFGSFVDGTSLL
jgi:histone deacetylase 6